MAADSEEYTALVLLELTFAFDAIGRSIMTNRLKD